MVKSSSLIEFGKALKEIRLSNGFSTYYVHENTGIKRETISKIENGKTLPRYDTLDILSVLYKVNLHLLFEEKRTVKIFTMIYKTIDDLLISFDLLNLKTLEKQYKELRNMKINDTVIDLHDLDKFESFIGLLTAHYEPESNPYPKIKKIVFLLTKLENGTIDDVLSKQYFDLLDLRLVSLLSAYLRKIKEFDDSISLLELILEKINSYDMFPTLSYKLHIKTAHNISYQYFNIEDYEKSLHYADYGIELSNAMNSNYILGQLYSRKCIAQIRLKMDSDVYRESFIMSLCSLKLQGESDLLEKYISIYESRYDLKMDKCELKTILNIKK